jgi:acyl-CoA synthetase (NDP forming)
MIAADSSPPPAVHAASHRLSPLLTPRSVALVGASPKAGSAGNGMIQAIATGAFAGRLYLVNPNYPEIEGRPCHPSLASLPEAVDLAVLGVANARLEDALKEAIAAGARAATIFASCYLPDDRAPKLAQRLGAMTREAGMPVCGGNGMGFYNLDHGLRVCGFPPPDWLRRGGTTFITHSGSLFSAFCHTEPRFAFNLAVSSGQELVTTAAEYLDFALDQPTTRVVGLFIETVREPEAFMAALAKARDKDIPIVVLKVGRSPESAALAVTHSGAIAGNDAAYRAVFDRYGVAAVDTPDEFANALQLLGGGRRLGPGGLASVHDSGGERELLVDLAVSRGVPFARIGKATTARLAARLDYGLEPVNPLDAWGTGHDFEGIFADCLTALMDDPDTAVGGFFVETRSGHTLSEGYIRALLTAASRTVKPVVLATNLASNGNDELQRRAAMDGIPVLNGADAALVAIRAALDRREFLERAPIAAAAAPGGERGRWASRLADARPLDEAESLALLGDYGIAAPRHRIAESKAGAIAAAEAVGYPAVLKTAAGSLHKSDVGGVKIGITDAAALGASYDDLAGRLGARVIVAAMVGKGIELAFGAVHDPQFGPLVFVGAGGRLVEYLPDRVFALPPFDMREARRLIDKLRLRPLLDGKRGERASDLAALAEALARFSVMAADLEGLVSEMDVNPVLAGPDGAQALDALVVPNIN